MLRCSPSPESLDSLHIALPLFITHIPLQDCSSPSNILDLLYASASPSLQGYRSACRLDFLQPNLTFPSFHDIPFSRCSLFPYQLGTPPCPDSIQLSTRTPYEHQRMFKLAL